MSTYVKIRETVSGTEYWNKDLKRTELFAPGTAPDDVQTEGMVGIYSASGKVAESVVDKVTATGTEEFSLDALDIDQLRGFAEANDIVIPANMKKLETIRSYIVEKLNIADGELMDDAE